MNLDHMHIENKFDDYEKEILLPHKMSQFGPHVAVGDIDNDGSEEFYVGGAAGQPGALYSKGKDSKFIATNNKVWELDKAYEDIGALFFDADNDNDLDLYVVSGGNEFENDLKRFQDRLYINNEGTFKKGAGNLPEITTSGSCVVSGDYDNDGDLDLFLGGRVIPGKYPFPPRSHILQNEDGVFTDVTSSVAPGLMNPGLVTSAEWTDFDKDGHLDLILVGEWMPVTMFRNTGEKLENMTSSYGLENTTGWWNRVASGDFDNDGDTDYVLGNLGLNYKYKVTEEEPLHIYCYDFDNSGSLDIVLGYYNQGVCYPVRGRQCSSEQMPFIKEKFPSYSAFGEANIETVYGESLHKAFHYEAKYFSSSLLENRGEKGFALHQLPVEAQFSTVNGIIVHDFDQDGNQDILIAGNFYVSEVETGRADASIGLYLEGDGNGEFRSVPVTRSGFFADRDVRDLKLLDHNTGDLFVLVANNNRRIQVFKVNTEEQNIQRTLAAKN